MMQRLKSSLESGSKLPPLTQNITEKKPKLEHFDEAIRQYSQNRDLRDAPLDKKISEFHLLLKPLTSEKLSDLQMQDITSLDDTVSYLEEIVEELGLSVSYEDIPSMEAGTRISLASIPTVIPICTIGKGRSSDEAREEAARRALYHLSIMTK